MKSRRLTSVITLLAMAAVFLTGAFMLCAGAAEEPSSKSNLSEAFDAILSEEESKDYKGIAIGLIDGMDDVAGYIGNIAVSLFADAGEVDFDKIIETFEGAIVAATPTDVQSTPTRPAGEDGEEPETKSFEEQMGDYAQSIITGDGVIGNILNTDPSEIVGGLSSAISRMSDTVRSGDALSGIGNFGGLNLGDISSITDLLGGVTQATTTAPSGSSGTTSYSYVYGYTGGSPSSGSSSGSSSSGSTYSSSGSSYSPVYSASPAGSISSGSVVTVPTVVDEVTTQYFLASSYSDANAQTTVAEGGGLIETTNSISGKKVAGAILVIMSCGVIGAIVIKKSM